jgi:hypothetical protein
MRIQQRATDAGRRATLLSLRVLTCSYLSEIPWGPCLTGFVADRQYMQPSMSLRVDDENAIVLCKVALFVACGTSTTPFARAVDYSNGELATAQHTGAERVHSSRLFSRSE